MVKYYSVMEYETFIELFAKDIEEKKLSKEKDVHICVFGKEGYGKSNFAIKLAIDLSKKLGWNFNEYNIVFTMQDFIIKFSEKKQIIVFDEAGVNFQAFTGRRKEQITGLLELILGRKRQNIVIYCVPAVFYIDKYIREHRLDAIFLVKHDKALMWLPDKFKILYDLLKGYTADLNYIVDGTEGRALKIKELADTMIYNIPFLGNEDKEFWEKYNKRKEAFSYFLLLKHMTKLSDLELYEKLKNINSEDERIEFLKKNLNLLFDNRTLELMRIFYNLRNNK